MNEAEYRVEFRRLGTEIKRIGEAEEWLLTQMERRPGPLAPTLEELDEWGRIDRVRDRLHEELEDLVRHWPEMASPTPTWR